MYDFLIDIIPREDIRIPEYHQHPHPTTAGHSSLCLSCLSASHSYPQLLPNRPPSSTALSPSPLMLPTLLVHNLHPLLPHPPTSPTPSLHRPPLLSLLPLLRIQLSICTGAATTPTLTRWTQAALLLPHTPCRQVQGIRMLTTRTLTNPLNITTTHLHNSRRTHGASARNMRPVQPRCGVAAYPSLLSSRSFF
jgi:hypothetical protein